MTRNEQKSSQEDRVLESFVALAQSSLGQLTPEQCLRGEREIRKRVARSRRPPAISWRNSMLVAAVIPLAVGVTLLFRRAARPEPLAYSIENGFLVSSQTVSGNGSATPLIRFTDGTEVRLEKDALAQIRYITPHGASLAVERGYLHAKVTHTAKAEWQFDAGPFTVRVTGTSFGLTWEPDQSRFDLRLEQGSVTVTGPVANEPIPVRAGQWLTIHSRSNEVLIRDLAASPVDPLPAPPSAVDPVTADSAESNSASLLPSAPPTDEMRLRPPATPEGEHNWAAELARGRLESIVNDAQSRGLDECLAKASSAELSALADAARYTRHNGIAQRALMAIRQRFAGSRKATESAFLLGKLAEAAKNEAAALAFFDTYLSESPSGTYASEALGRKMAIVRNTSGSAIARPLARDYLVRYPGGTYASAARAILENP